MTDAQPLRPQQESDTEVLPPATSGEGIARTRELPVVEDEPTVVAPPPSAPSAQPTVVTPPPSAPAPRPSAPAPSTPPAGTARRPLVRPLVLAAVAAVAVLAVLAGVVALRGARCRRVRVAAGGVGETSVHDHEL